MHLVPLLLVLLFASTTWGQKAIFKTLEIGKEDGIPNTLLGDGMQCSRGYIWFHGHHSGFFRYDGIEVKNYTQLHNNLGGDIVRFLEESKDSLLWIRTKGSSFEISVFDPTTEKATSIQDFFKDTLPFDPSIVSIYKNKDGTIWFYNPMEENKVHIYEYNGKSLELWGAYPASMTTRTIYKLNDSTFFHISSYGKNPKLSFLYKDGRLLQQRSLSKKFDSLRFLGPLDTLTSSYLITYKHVSDTIAYLAKIGLDRPITLLDSLEHGFYDHHHNSILKFHRKKLTFLDLNLQHQYQVDIPYTAPHSFEDQQGGIWVVDKVAGLSRYQFSDTLFQQYNCQTINPNLHPPARGITQSSSGDLWIVQFKNLFHQKKNGDINVYHRYDFPSHIHREFNGLFYQESKDILWLASINNILKLNPDQPTKNSISYPFEEEKHRGHQQVYIDKNETIWVGNSTGLFQIHEQDSIILPYEKYNEYTALKKVHILAFHENKAGLWLATGSGIFLLDYEKGIVAHYHDQGEGKNYLPCNYFYHLHEDREGIFWLASKSNGLIKWNPSTGDYQQFTKKNGLVDNLLYAVYEDDYEQLWLPSNNGLMSFNKKTEEVITYLEEDGIPNLEFNTLSHYQGEDGRLYFGGLKGVAGFHPRTLKDRNSKSNLQITNFRKQNYKDEFYLNTPQELLRNHSFELTPDDKSFELSFALLDFKAIQKNLYAYKIEGYDQNWQSLAEPNLKINKLPYGTYQLRLKAKAPAYSWKELTIPITIHVLRPFYLQTWFLILAFIIVLISIYKFIQWRLSKLEQQKAALELIVQERTSEIAEQAEQLKVLDKVKSRFFANVSHELRTPLSLILGPISTLEEKPFEILSKDKFHHNIDLMKRNSNKLLDLIDEILDLSKLEAGKLELKEKATDLKQYIYRLFNTFESLSSLKEINYQINYEVSKDLKVLIDPNKVEKILNNFLNNAFKFTSKNGSISLKVSEQPNSILIALEDSGKGIEDEDLPHVFERFYQSKNPNLKAQGGTGIGLALARELAHLMQAKVWVESEVTKGSCFYFEFPKKVVQEVSSKVQQQVESLQEQHQPANEKTWQSLPKPKTLLLVEDNVDLRRYIHSILESHYNVLLAENGKEGLNVLETNQQNIDLILSDVMMPIMDGFSMLEIIKKHNVWRSLPMIMLTARASEQDKLKALTIGVDDYLTKPFSTDELLIRIQNLLQNYAARQLWKQELILTANTVRGKDPKKTAKKEATTIEKEPPNVSVKDLQWMKEVEEQIKANLQEDDFEMSVLAQKLFISKRQLDRKILKITGLTPAKLLREVRLQTAKTYLEKGTFNNISEVSFAVGFKTASHFSKIYYSRFGKRPKEFF